ncbi:MAG: HAMP domain-containing histidine kinase [Acidobacteria bacterium]|nr:HAMP domain-containing histidine kinase [Acidobacteriota bacterium]
MLTTDFGDLLAERMQLAHREIATRWFGRLLDLLPVDAREVFPSSLLDHIPALIVEIAASLREPNTAFAANTAMLDKARELGSLRHAQRASLHQVVREYQILGSILVTFVAEQLDALGLEPPPADTVRLVARLHEAVNVLSQATIESFVALYTQTIADQHARLEEFTRLAAHEWRQPLGAIQFAVSLLDRDDGSPERRERRLDTLRRNVAHLVALTRKLESVARLHGSGDDDLLLQTVPASTVVQEAARQLRDAADAQGVELRIASDLPSVTVDVGRFELIFVNLLSNAIKYADPTKDTRVVEVTGTADAAGWCRFEVRDNGLGIPSHALNTIFERFTRAHGDHAHAAQVAGVGLGLAIVDDCVRAIGGRIDVTSVEGDGTTFTVSIPESPGAPLLDRAT